MAARQQLVPTLPQSINDLDDLPSNYKVTDEMIAYTSFQRANLGQF